MIRDCNVNYVQLVQLLETRAIYFLNQCDVCQPVLVCILYGVLIATNEDNYQVINLVSHTKTIQTTHHTQMIQRTMDRTISLTGHSLQINLSDILEHCTVFIAQSTVG